MRNVDIILVGGGKGKIKFKNGDKYKSEFKDGRMSGWGKMKYRSLGEENEEDFALFEGEF